MKSENQKESDFYIVPFSACNVTVTFYNHVFDELTMFLPLSFNLVPSLIHCAKHFSKILQSYSESLLFKDVFNAACIMQQRFL